MRVLSCEQEIDHPAWDDNRIRGRAWQMTAKIEAASLSLKSFRNSTFGGVGLVVSGMECREMVSTKGLVDAKDL